MIFSGFGPWAAYVPAWTKNQLLLHKKFFFCCMRVSCAWIILMICSLQTICAHHISAQTLSDISISLSLKDESLDQAFKKIEQLTPFRFAYRKNDTKDFQHLTLDVRLKKVKEVLDLLLQGSPLAYEQNDYTIFITNKAPGVEQLIQKGSTTDTAIVVRGKVLSQDGSPLAGAVVTVKGTRFGTATATNGNFEIKDVPLNSTLVVTFVGYQTYEANITGATSYLLIKMQPSEVLDEVTVVSTGYQKLPKERSTGSFSVITAQELEKIPTANLIQRIEGLVTGLQPKIMAGDNSFLYQGLTQGINSTTRTVGTNDYDVNVRGNTTLLGEKMPLMVVDGFPTEFDIKWLNPSDIEQITVLKDAAAASIWGARAANGVIVIDTKKGKNRQMPSINFGASYTAYSAPRFNYLPLANSGQMINYEEEVINKGLNLYNPFTSAPAYKYYKSDASDLVYKVKAGLIDSATFNSEIAKLSAINGYDQYKQYLLQSANAQNYNLSVSGGNDFHTYFFSGSYTREVPSAKGTYGDRFTLTSNQSFKLFKIATLDFSLKAALFNYTNNGIGLSKLSNGTSAYLPYNQVVDENGNKVYYSYNYYKGRTDTLQSLRGYQNWGYNYLDELSASDKTIKDQNYSGIINLNVPIYKGLSVSGQFMIEKYYQLSRMWNSPDSYAARDLVNQATSVNYATGNLTYGIPKGGILLQNNSSNTDYSARAQAMYNATIHNIHRLNAVAGAEIRQTQQSQTSPPAIYGYNMQTGVGQPMLTSYTDVNGYTQTTYAIQSTLQADKTRRFLSYYANAAYTLLNKYSLSGSVRYDDYNNFGVDRKYRATPLWSTGVKWNITGEDFLKQYTFINNLALRATYGYNGNIAQGIYPFTNISLGSSNYVTGLPYATISSPANPALRWEKTGILNLAIDYSLFNNRISGSVEYYTKKATDLLWNFPIDPTYGIYTYSVSGLLTNNTRVNAKGYEVAVTGVMIKQKNINWAATFNFSYSQNKIVDSRFVPTSSTYSSLSGTNIAGYPTTALWAYRFAGLDNNGMTQVYGADKSTKLAPSQNPTSINALYYAGNTTAPYYGSLSQIFRYKQFTLFAMGTYSFGSVFRKPTVSTYTSARYPSVQYDLNKDIDKRWRKPGDEATTNVPGIAGAYAPVSLFRYDFSDINILSGSYIRLREVSLGYDLPALIASKITAKNINFTITVRNPGLIWTKNKEHIDPDFIPYLSSNTLALPPSASFNMALNMTF
jgi:TonB-linked SusC/RagA family outer membrane protein